METAPRDLDVGEIRTALGDTPGVLEVHDLHVWAIGSGEVSFSTHVVAKPDADAAALLSRIQQMLASRFGLDHATIQIEPPRESGDGCPTDCETPS